ncbi:barstar family protein [Bacillus sp. BP-3]|uniref:barstar family protein n=1 Tax=Bacillus sp. BP-3 TaxID=3022773 RepID=UPI00232BDDEF|nr:barstar family protein [Bacillus sp. BP-3]MDC2866318.1 barstar family protein [Bacillus sp. BP-3]
MKKILNGHEFISKEALHKILKERLELPDYYGENADPLWYWITLPLAIEWACFEEGKKFLSSYAELILETFQHAQKEMIGEFFIIVK